jgi:hypothetical protein
MTADERLMRQALNALEGVLAMAAHRGIKPTDMTQTIIAKLRERLLGRSDGVKGMGVTDGR